MKRQAMIQWRSFSLQKYKFRGKYPVVKTLTMESQLLEPSEDKFRNQVVRKIRLAMRHQLWWKQSNLLFHLQVDSGSQFVVKVFPTSEILFFLSFSSNLENAKLGGIVGMIKEHRQTPYLSFLRRSRSRRESQDIESEILLG